MHTRWFRNHPVLTQSLAVAALVGLTLAVHDVGYLLRYPFWLDESWVADATRLPWSQLREMTGQSPILFTALVHLMPGGGHQYLRLLPLAFAGLAVVTGWLFGRSALSTERAGRPRASRLGGLLVAAATLLVPAMLVRDDLKPYTADAAISLLLLWLLVRWDRRPGAVRLATVGVVGAAGMLLSHAAGLVAPTCLLAASLALLTRRAWRAFGISVAIGAASGAAMTAVYLAFDAGHANRALDEDWVGFFPTVRDGYASLGHFVADRYQAMATATGVPLILLGLLLVLALAFLWRKRLRASALVMVILPGLLFGLAAAHRYPFLDPRTSTFYAVCLIAWSTIAVVALARLARRFVRPRGAFVGAAVIAAATGAFLYSTHDLWRSHAIAPGEVADIRAQVAYVEAHRLPGDVVIVNRAGVWGFGYYARQSRPVLVPDSSVATGFILGFPDDPRIMVVQRRDVSAVFQTISDAVQKAAPYHHIWIIRTHERPAEEAAFRFAIQTLHGWTVPVGPEPLAVLPPYAWRYLR